MRGMDAVLSKDRQRRPIRPGHTGLPRECQSGLKTPAHL